MDGTLAPSGTVFSKYLLEKVFREHFKTRVPEGAKVPLGASLYTRHQSYIDISINIFVISLPIWCYKRIY